MACIDVTTLELQGDVVSARLRAFLAYLGVYRSAQPLLPTESFAAIKCRLRFYARSRHGRLLLLYWVNFTYITFSDACLYHACSCSCCHKKKLIKMITPNI
jgi:hypothetical protein